MAAHTCAGSFATNTLASQIGLDKGVENLGGDEVVVFVIVVGIVVAFVAVVVVVVAVEAEEEEEGEEEEEEEEEEEVDEGTRDRTFGVR